MIRTRKITKKFFYSNVTKWCREIKKFQKKKKKGIKKKIVQKYLKRANHWLILRLHRLIYVEI